MNKLPANCPEWLTKKIISMGGTISFYEYMDIVLNDQDNGYYGSGKANLGIHGDFVTSPSISKDFSVFIAEQIEDWLKQISSIFIYEDKFTILEFGAGNGIFFKGSN